MEPDDETAFDLGFQAGAQAARAGIASDLKTLADSFRDEIARLRADITRLAGLPASALADRGDNRIQ
jgi:hypothetical protein